MKVIIDTDPGIDDAMAIAYAAAHPDIDLMALTSVFGNIDLDTATRNAIWLSQISGAQVPVYRGADQPLLGGQPHFVPHIHGDNGLGNVAIPQVDQDAQKLTAAHFLVETANADPGQVTVCAIGPLTNIAQALAIDPSFIGKLRQLVIMGGSLRAGGNVTPFAEANFHSDPEAAQQVLTSADRDRISVVGLDVTTSITAELDDFRILRVRAGPIGALLLDAVRFYMDFHFDSIGKHLCFLHDPTALIYAVRPDLFEIERHHLNIHLEGDERGRLRTLQSSDGAAVSRVIMHAERDKTITEFFSTLGGP